MGLYFGRNSGVGSLLMARFGTAAATGGAPWDRRLHLVVHLGTESATPGAGWDRNQVILVPNCTRSCLSRPKVHQQMFGDVPKCTSSCRGSTRHVPKCTSSCRAPSPCPEMHHQTRHRAPREPAAAQTLLTGSSPHLRGARDSFPLARGRCARNRGQLCARTLGMQR